MYHQVSEPSAEQQNQPDETEPSSLAPKVMALPNQSGSDLAKPVLHSDSESLAPVKGLGTELCFRNL
ncbi:hypothetical protein U1Q18_021617 [Sarracenia purpurea var. burkii]